MSHSSQAEPDDAIEMMRRNNALGLPQSFFDAVDAYREGVAKMDREFPSLSDRFARGITSMMAARPSNAEIEQLLARRRSSQPRLDLNAIVADAVAQATSSPTQSTSKPGPHDAYIGEWLGNQNLRAVMDCDEYIESRCRDDGLPIPKRKSEPTQSVCNPLLGSSSARFSVGSDWI